METVQFTPAEWLTVAMQNSLSCQDCYLGTEYLYQYNPRDKEDLGAWKYDFVMQ